ncbi:hypothetical protein B484DRAFT_442213 [Ochromonadaceae sp. CCMP2298]|nr:hypothetical protein B484DRAFT_442213 [Ochromonadaceae sp. CCMP2298]
MQFASGLPPSRVYRLDLVPERTYAEAHRLIARDFSAFLSAKTLSVLGALEGEQAMQERLAQTHAFVAPLLEALHLEGYHNFRPPCVSRCSTECSSCTAGCPFSAVSQATMGGLQGIPLTNTDSFGTRLPKVQRSDEGVRTQTSTQGCYHTGEDLQIWDLHFHSRGLDLDTGSLPLSAFELKTKMKSRQSLHRLAGIDFCGDEVGGGMGVCGEINQQSVDWAHAHAGPATLARYTAYGQKYTIGPDMDVRSGPCWIWNELEYAESEDGETVQVRSPSLCTPLHIPLPPLSGLHYCKVLSPARVLEWMYVDSLRAKYSLSTYSPPHSAYSQSTNGTA